MKIFDCFPYFNERELLELRIKLLYDVVDKFIICEANRTHEGKSKEFTAKKILEQLGLFTDKVTVIEVKIPSKAEVENNWVRENMQRDALTSQVQDYDTVCIVTDLDEIMDPNFVKYYASVAAANKNNILRIPMTYLNVKGDLKVTWPSGHEIGWASGFIGMKQHFDCYSPSKIRESYAFDLNNIKFKDIFQIDNGINLKAGWHFTWMGGRAKMIDKWSALADQNDNICGIVEQGNKEAVKQLMLTYDPHEGSTDPLGRANHRLTKYSVHNLPELIFKLEGAKNYIFPKEYKREHFYDSPQFGENWFTYPNLYKKMVQRFPSGSKFAEIGVWKGRSIAYLTVEMINAGKSIECYCIDTWAGSFKHQPEGTSGVSKEELNNLFDTFSKNLLSVKDHYIPIQMESLKAAERFADESLDFVFIDAAHEYEHVKADILKWLPKVKKGGVLAGHDCYPNNPEFGGVYRAVSEILPNKFTVSENCWIYEKL